MRDPSVDGRFVTLRRNDGTVKSKIAGPGGACPRVLGVIPVKFRDIGLGRRDAVDVRPQLDAANARPLR
jgi:hypothetical protein